MVTSSLIIFTETIRNICDADGSIKAKKYVLWLNFKLSSGFSLAFGTTQHLHGSSRIRNFNKKVS